jgi:hypothetical protein
VLLLLTAAAAAGFFEVLLDDGGSNGQCEAHNSGCHITQDSCVPMVTSPQLGDVGALAFMPLKGPSMRC